MRLRASLLDKNGVRLDGLGCDADGCQRDMTTVANQTMTMGHVLGAGAGGITIQGALSGRDEQPRLLYAINMTESEPVWLTATTCVPGTSPYLHASVHIFMGATPPVSFALYGGTPGDARASSTSTGCGTGPHGTVSLLLVTRGRVLHLTRSLWPPCAQVSAAVGLPSGVAGTWNGMVYVAVVPDPNLPATATAANRTGPFKLNLKAEPRGDPVDCPGVIFLRMYNSWTQCVLAVLDLVPPPLRLSHV